MKDHSTPKYLKLKQEILSWILAGKLQANEQIPSENELASEFRISRHTVRQAIGDMVKDEWLYRIQGKGTFVKSPKIRMGESAQTIGVITTYISDYIFPLIIRGAESTLRQKGYRLLLASTDNDKQKEKESLEMMIDYPLSGLIIEPTKSALQNENLSYYLQLEYQNIPYIMMNESYPELNCPVLKVDDQRGGFIATEHLIQLGHEKIAGFFKTDDLQGVNRMTGFIQANQQYNQYLLPDWVHQYTTETSTTAPIKVLQELLSSKQRPTAIVCYNDQLAIRLLEVIRQQGLKVPEDLSIVSFDDSALATATEVKLTSVSHPKIHMGVQAAELLISLIDGKYDNKQTAVEQPSLVVRDSTRSLNLS